MKKAIYKLTLFSTMVLTVLLFSVTVSANDSDLPARYGRSTISDPAVAYVYDTLASELSRLDPPESIELDRDMEISEQELVKAFTLFKSDYPECFWVGSTYRYSHIENNIVSASFDYSFQGEALTKARSALENAINNIMLGMPNTSNYDKALYLHDALCRRVTYEAVGEHQTAYGALVSEKAVCAGYAAAYQLLLQRAGIDAWTVTGISSVAGKEPVAHAWNVLWLEDGVCVYADTTWDDNDSGELFHCYFAITRDEMEFDHTTDALFVLPECTHGDKSYFDVYGGKMDDSTSPADFAALFGPEQDGKRTSRFYYAGEDFGAWFEENKIAVYEALSCDLYEPIGYSLSSKGMEIHLTVTAVFPPETYKITLNVPDTISTTADSVQYVEFGQGMQALTYTAREGYYFPEDYHVQGTSGISVIRLNARQIEISGTPEADTAITLAPAAQMKKESTPLSVYTPVGNGTGTLSGITVGMKYSFDGINWTDILSNEDIHFERIDSPRLLVVRKGDGESTLDSDILTLTVTNTYEPPKETAAEKGSDTEGTDTQALDSSEVTEKSETKKSSSSNGSSIGIDLGCEMSAESTVIILLTALAVFASSLKKKKR